MLKRNAISVVALAILVFLAFGSSNNKTEPYQPAVVDREDDGPSEPIRVSKKNVGRDKENPLADSLRTVVERYKAKDYLTVVNLLQLIEVANNLEDKYLQIYADSARQIADRAFPENFEKALRYYKIAIDKIPALESGVRANIRECRIRLYRKRIEEADSEIDRLVFDEKYIEAEEKLEIILSSFEKLQHLDSDPNEEYRAIAEKARGVLKGIKPKADETKVIAEINDEFEKISKVEKKVKEGVFVVKFKLTDTLPDWLARFEAKERAMRIAYKLIDNLEWIETVKITATMNLVDKYGNDVKDIEVFRVAFSREEVMKINRKRLLPEDACDLFNPWFHQVIR